MWLRKPNSDKTHTTLRAGVALAAALVLSACGAAYVEQDGASVLLLVESIGQEGAPVLSDVRGENGVIVNCQTTVSVLARPKNPNSPVGVSEDVRLSRYSISYRRSDGRGAQGVDVPYTINGVVTVLVPSDGDAAAVTLDLVRHQAKLEPPLSNIVGLQIVTMFAEITVSGQTVSGKTVTGSGSTQVTFADFADGTDTCES